MNRLKRAAWYTTLLISVILGGAGICTFILGLGLQQVDAMLVGLFGFCIGLAVFLAITGGSKWNILK